MGRLRVRFIALILSVWVILATWTTLTLLVGTMLPSHTQEATPEPSAEDDIFVQPKLNLVYTDAPRTQFLNRVDTPTPVQPKLNVVFTNPPTTPAPPQPTSSEAPVTPIPSASVLRETPRPHTSHHHHHHHSEHLRGYSSDGLEPLIASVLAPHKKRWFVQSNTSDQVNNTVFAASGCDLFTVPFNPMHDTRCLAFLTNMSLWDWESLKPMSQEYDERTVKFKLRFKGVPHLQAIIKTPQKLFPTEAFGEIGAYHFDRLIKMNRVPPTGLVCIPLEKLREITRLGSNAIPLLDIFAKQSNVHDYNEWIEKDVYDFTKETKCVHVSVQLFMAFIIRYLDSIYTIPYKPHNASWQRFFTPEIGFPTHKSALKQDLYRVGLIHMGALVTVDYIAGNIDRSPNKNNFVAGGCEHPHRTDNCEHAADDLLHTGFPSFVNLDQGMYFVTTPKRSPLHQDNSTFCIFSATLHATLQDIAKRGRNTINEEMKARLDPYVYEKLDRPLSGREGNVNAFRKCDSRLRRVLKHIKKCVEKYGHDVVLIN